MKGGFFILCFGLNCRGFEKLLSSSHVAEGRRESFVDVLKKTLSSMVDSGEVCRAVGGKISHSEGQSSKKAVHILKHDGVGPNEGTTRSGNDLSLQNLQEVLLDIKHNIDLMLKWIESGLGHVGFDGFNNGFVDA